MARMAAIEPMERNTIIVTFNVSMAELIADFAVLACHRNASTCYLATFGHRSGQSQISLVAP
jgi:hypothetical protein